MKPFLVTDTVTKEPITDGDAVVAFVMGFPRDPFPGGTMEFESLPIAGVYNGFGNVSVSSEDDIAVRLLLKATGCGSWGEFCENALTWRGIVDSRAPENAPWGMYHNHYALSLVRAETFENLSAKLVSTGEEAPLDVGAWVSAAASAGDRCREKLAALPPEEFKRVVEHLFVNYERDTPAMREVNDLHRAASLEVLRAPPWSRNASVYGRLLTSAVHQFGLSTFHLPEDVRKTFQSVRRRPNEPWPVAEANDVAARFFHLDAFARSVLDMKAVMQAYSDDFNAPLKRQPGFQRQLVALQAGLFMKAGMGGWGKDLEDALAGIEQIVANTRAAVLATSARRAVAEAERSPKPVGAAAP